MKLKPAIIILLLGLVTHGFSKDHKSITSFSGDNVFFTLTKEGITIPVILDMDTDKGVARAAEDLCSDFERVTGQKPMLLHELPASGKAIIIGVTGKSALLDRLMKAKKIDEQQLKGKYEKYLITTIAQPFPGIEEALVIAGSDKRGAIYGIYELSEQIGVSPWYYWADVPVVQRQDIGIVRGSYTAGEPQVKFRGIFLNDEAPALTGWVNENFGGYNSKFYTKVFELILRLRGNFLWPAMWDAAFYDDDPLNSPLAQEYGIVMGTSHHEPMARAHKEWKRYGKGSWNYDKNVAVLDSFWRKGIERMKNTEDLVTIAMRGDGDEPMSESANIALLEQIVQRQREIITEVTGKAAAKTPQVWALYKEVQEYYDRGMRVPEDVTLLLCDDNWGNIRKLPAPDAPQRKGGYGIYYHFDYVGGPRNYKWINVTPIQKIWEQMNLCYEYGVDKIWVVNVGDLKPMEYPITFFLDMAWNPARFHSKNLPEHTETFCRELFGGQHAVEMARIINLYTKYNRRVTPELLNEKIYSLDNHNEFERVTNDYSTLAYEALQLYYLLPDNQRDSYNQLVLYPVQAMANLYEMYYAVAMNHRLYHENNNGCNNWADKAEQHFVRDSILAWHYNHVMSGGKWNHFMDQTHIGYTYWQQPPKNVMPAVYRIESSPIDYSKKPFIEKDGYIAIEAEHYSKSSEGQGVHWTVIPGFGKTLSGLTLLPAKMQLRDEHKEQVYVEYFIETSTITDSARLTLIFAPSLNFNQNKGLRYAVCIDGQTEQVVNINQSYTIKEMEKWQANSANKSSSIHAIPAAGQHTIRIRFLNTGLVLEKLLLDMGGAKETYL